MTTQKELTPFWELQGWSVTKVKKTRIWVTIFQEGYYSFKIIIVKGMLNSDFRLQLVFKKV